MDALYMPQTPKPKKKRKQVFKLIGTCSVRKIRRQRGVEGQGGLEKRKAN